MTKDRHDYLLETIATLEKKIAVAQGERQQIMRELKEHFGITKPEQIGPLIDKMTRDYNRLSKEADEFYQRLQTQYGGLLNDS